MSDVEDSEKLWIRMVAQNEINLLKFYRSKGDLGLAYEKAEHNAWIVKTLKDKKQRYRFPKCKNLVMIGSGMYPYSMFDVHKQYPHINQIGIEIDPQRALISKRLIEVSPAKSSIKIEVMDGYDYDYSWLNHDDLIFISVDVDHKRIVEKCIETSKAHINVCAPYDKTWLKNLIKSFSV